jgi:hypothetical protein
MNTSPEVRQLVSDVAASLGFATEALATSAEALAEVSGYERDAVLIASLSNLLHRSTEGFEHHLKELDTLIAQHPTADTPPGAQPLRTLLKTPAQPLAENDLVVPTAAGLVAGLRLL